MRCYDKMHFLRANHFSLFLVSCFLSAVQLKVYLQLCMRVENEIPEMNAEAYFCDYSTRLIFTVRSLLTFTEKHEGMLTVNIKGGCTQGEKFKHYFRTLD